MSAVTLGYIVEDSKETELLFGFLEIVFYGLGSVFFAAILLTIVSIIRTLLGDEEDAEISDISGFASGTIKMTFRLLFELFEIFVRKLTSWAMIIVAIKGCNLTEALKSFFLKLKRDCCQ
ncbi:Choline transporter-like protein 1 [Cucumispora dikerogammari]|nr:Choline transporter-like protein 1 [Cucumispora dikerogammari]